MLKLTEANINANMLLRADRAISNRVATLESSFNVATGQITATKPLRTNPVQNYVDDEVFDITKAQLNDSFVVNTTTANVVITLPELVPPECNGMRLKIKVIAGAAGNNTCELRCDAVGMFVNNYFFESNNILLNNWEECELLVYDGTYFRTDVITLPVLQAGKLNQRLGSYFTCTKVYNCIGSYTGAITVHYTKLGNMVNMTVQGFAFTAAGANTITIVGQGDPLLLPSVDIVHASVYRKVDGSFVSLVWFLDDEGLITIRNSASLAGTFVDLDVYDCLSCSLSYVTDP